MGHSVAYFGTLPSPIAKELAMHTDTTTLFTEKDLIRPLLNFPTSVVITKELLLLRLAIANLNVKSQVVNTDTWHDALCAADCCRWDLEGYLQN